MLFRLPRSRRDRVLRYLFLLPDPFLIGSQRSEASCHRRHRSERSWASFPFEASSIRGGEVYPKSLNKAQRRRSPTSPVGSKARDGESGVGWSWIRFRARNCPTSGRPGNGVSRKTTLTTRFPPYLSTRLSGRPRGSISIVDIRGSCLPLTFGPGP